MGRIFDDPHEQARREREESGCPYCGHIGCDERCQDSGQEDDEPSHYNEDDEFSEEGGGEEAPLSLCESFHFLLHSDPSDRDPEWEEINRKVLAGAKPKP